MPNDEFPLIAETTNVYFRDLYNHTVQAIYTLDSFHETVSGLVDLYMSSIRQRRNEVMQVLTIMASLSISLTFIVGIYGMNFVVEPELKWHWGLPDGPGADVELCRRTVKLTFQRKDGSEAPPKQGG